MEGWLAGTHSWWGEEGGVELLVIETIGENMKVGLGSNQGKGGWGGGDVTKG